MSTPNLSPSPEIQVAMLAYQGALLAWNVWQWYNQPTQHLPSSIPLQNWK